MARVRVIQRSLRDIIKVIFIQHPIDIGKFTVLLLEDDLLKVRDELGIDFDDVIVYPGPQPRESGDVELLKNKKVVEKISVKTAVSGDVKVAFKKVWQDIKNGQNGMILAIYTCKERETDKDVVKLIMIYLPKTVKKYSYLDVYSEFKYMMTRKAERENCDKFMPLAINDAVQFEYLRKIMIIEEATEKAIAETKKVSDVTKKLSEAVKIVSEEAKKASEEAKKAAKMTEETRDLVQEILKRLEKMQEKHT